MVMHLRICSKRSKFEHLLKTRPQAEVLHRLRPVVGACESSIMSETYEGGGVDGRIKGFLVLPLAITAVVITGFVMGALQSEEDLRTPREVMEESDKNPSSVEFYTLLCVETANTVLSEKLELNLEVWGSVTAQWVDKERGAGKVYFTRANKVQTYCTLLTTESLGHPIRGAILRLTEMPKDVVVTAVRACASHWESTPTKDIYNRLHAPCYDLKPDEDKTYELIMLLDDHRLIGDSNLIVVGRRKAGDPTLIP